MSKVVLITGGSSGLGKAIGELLSNKGFTIYGTSRNPEKHQNEISFSLLKMEVTNQDSIAEVISEIINREQRIDVVINNAGVGITGPIEETPYDEIRKAFDINYHGPINVIKAVLPQMRKQNSGLIINITSIAGYMGLPYRGIYSASKSALEITTETLRMEVKQFGIKMTNIAPGDFATNIAASRFHAPVLENSPYKEVYGNSLKTMNQHVEEGENPAILAAIVHNIINETNPKVRYKVGSNVQKFSIVLKRILPSKWYEKMLMKHFNIK
ncbi:MAG: short-chain dehydrogenase/reductase [Flavobacterium sp.]|nr:MAG: short-chain dehydrogenase/reductase [Flavobacterium sp.]